MMQGICFFGKEIAEGCRLDYNVVMNYTELYRQLKELAARLDIQVSEQNLRATGVNAKSGLCRIKGKRVFIMDKHLPIREKAEILADCFRELPLENVYLMPAVRGFIDPHGEWKEGDDASARD